MINEIWFLLLPAGFLLYIVYDFKLFYKIDKEGFETDAVILHLQGLGGRKGDSSEVRFAVKVVNEKGVEETLRFTTYISPIKSPHVQPGEIVRVKYMRKKNKIQAIFVFS